MSDSVVVSDRSDSRLMLCTQADMEGRQREKARMGYAGTLAFAIACDRPTGKQAGATEISGGGDA